MGNFLAKVAPTSNLSTTFFPPPATFHPSRDIPDLSNKVILVTGGNAGIGYETCKQILLKNGHLYLAARSETKALQAIDALEKETGKRAIFLQLDLGDLKSVRKAAEEFLSKEERLDVLFNNAGVMIPPTDQVTTSGYDMQFGTNVVGHWLFTNLLIPALSKSLATTGEVARIINTSSTGHEFAPETGYEWVSVKAGKERDAWVKKKGMMASWTLYGESKLGNLQMSNYWAREYPGLIVSTSLHPGGIKTELQRHAGTVLQAIANALLYPPRMGAYTQLWGAFVAPPEVMNGQYLLPWGRVGIPTKTSGDLKIQEELIKWLENEVKGL